MTQDDIPGVMGAPGGPGGARGHQGPPGGSRVPHSPIGEPLSLLALENVTK